MIEFILGLTVSLAGTFAFAYVFGYFMLKSEFAKYGAKDAQ